MADPLCIKDLKDYGFNVVNTANNHSMDYSHGGLLATLRHLDDFGLPHCGTGRNLADASAPCFVECREGRVAFIGVTSSFHDSYAAGPQNQDMQGRPGVAPLRHKAVYELDAQNFNDLVRIASVTGINSYHDQARKEGYLPQTDEFKFGTFNFIQGEENRVVTTPLNVDMDRTVCSIRDAKLQSDVVVVSVHSHQFKGLDKHNTPDFISEFCRNCIDAGADIIVCHGPHVMRGVENYNNGIILCGLGDFILQHETMNVIPEEQYWKEGRTRQNTDGVATLLNIRSKGGTRGLVADRDAWVSYIATISWDGGIKEVVLRPFEIESRNNNGLPYLSSDSSIIDSIERMSNIAPPQCA